MSADTNLVRQILKRHGARSDLRLFRNETGVYWAGKPQGKTPEGHLILAHASRVASGLAVGSADIIGIRQCFCSRCAAPAPGQFLSIEAKAIGRTGRKTATEPAQIRWLEMVMKFGGLGAIVSTVDEVTELLGPPGRRL